MTSTLTDCVIRNISLQANAKINDELIQEMNKTIQDLTDANELLKGEISNANNRNLTQENDIIKKLQENVSRLRMEVQTHIENAETYRNQLIRERENSASKLDEMNKKIAKLKNPAGKKSSKKVEEVVEPVETPEVTQEIVENKTEDTVRDGGEF